VKRLLLFRHFLLMKPTFTKILFLLATFISACFLAVKESRIGEAKAQQQRPPMFVLQVGIGKYLDAPKWSDLRGSITDVVEMRKLLEGERFQIPAANITTLTNEKATKHGIFAAFRDALINKAKDNFEKTKRRDAVVLFQYSGHGSQAPDVDGDEVDKLDETLVTYDSQDVKGKNFDITDDEIFALTSELKRYTDNIVYVFDSCHSGSGTRNAEDARRLPVRTTVPETVPMPGITTRSGSAGDDASEGSVLPPGSDYIVISAAQAEQLATQKYCFEECGGTTEPVVFGLLTYYLIDELKNARSDTSYRELMENVVRKVEAERPTQTPLIEGDARRLVFGSIGKTGDSYIPISAVDPKSIKIRAGAIHGVTVGSIVSFYDRGVAKFDSAEKIASGQVVSLTAAEAVVRLGTSQRAVTIADKAVVASSDLAVSRSKVMIEDAAIARAIREAFAPKEGVPDERGVDVLPSNAVSRQTGRWNLAVLKDKYSKVFPNSRGAANPPNCGAQSEAASGDADIYYITGQDYSPMFGFCVDAADSGAANSLVRALTHIARYRSIQQIQNRRSRLAGKVLVKPIRLITNSGAFSGTTNCVDGKFTVDKYETLLPSSAGRFPIGTGEVFWFEVTNNSPFDVYVSMLNLRSDASVRVQFPRNVAEEKNGVMIPKNGGKRIVNGDRCRINAEGDFTETGAFRASRTPEQDIFKFFVTTTPLTWDKLSFLEMDSIRRNENASLATINEWIALDLALDVGGTTKK
jgi:hypothetical protein